MTNSTADYTNLLQEAIRLARENAPRAVDDLRRCASEAAGAVAEVTGDGIVLELVPINQSEDLPPAYQLQLYKAGSEAPPSDLGVYCVSTAGYPVQRWYSRNGWETHPNQSDQTYPNVTELENHFRRMISRPESRLVVLITFFQEQGAQSPATNTETA